MKTSEIIRNAIDTQLSTINNVNWICFKEPAPYLCWAIVQSLIEEPKIDGLNLPGCIELLPDQAKELLKIIEEETQFFIHTPNERVQQMRYMYADFLAYYFEDMGD